MFSDKAKKWLFRLGGFGLTVKGDTIKGWARLDEDDEYERTYYDAKDLRELASAALEIAEILEVGVCPYCEKAMTDKNEHLACGAVADG